MRIYSLVNQAQDGLVITERLNQLVHLEPVDVEAVKQKIIHGDVIFISGGLLQNIENRVRGDVLEFVLNKGGHIILHPPFLSETLEMCLPQFGSFTFLPAEFSPIRFIGEDLTQVTDSRTFNILFNSCIKSGPGKGITSSEHGEPVANSYQHRSNWGILVCTTLLLTSTSIRSPRSERAAFIHGLIKWLQSFTAPETVTLNLENEKSTISDLDLSTLIIGLYLTQNGGIVNRQTIINKIESLQTTMQIKKISLGLDEALNQLGSSIIISSGIDTIAINLDQLIQEINRRRLWSYLRRLK